MRNFHCKRLYEKTPQGAFFNGENVQLAFTDLNCDRLLQLIVFNDHDANYQHSNML